MILGLKNKQANKNLKYTNKTNKKITCTNTQAKKPQNKTQIKNKQNNKNSATVCYPAGF